MRHWYFRDYVDQRGQNLVRQWLDSLPIAAQLKIDTYIRYLEITPNLQRPYIAALKGKYNKLLEIRVLSQNIQYRPLAFHGPKRYQITILFGAIEKGDQFEPKSACDIAYSRMAIVNANETRSCEHEYN